MKSAIGDRDACAGDHTATGVGHRSADATAIGLRERGRAENDGRDCRRNAVHGLYLQRIVDSFRFPDCTGFCGRFETRDISRPWRSEKKSPQNPLRSAVFSFQSDNAGRRLVSTQAREESELS
jgi:hypothetical protein